MSEIRRGVLNSTRCWCLGPESHSCPLSVAVGVWTIVSHVDFDMQTSICRCLHPFLYDIEGERLISRSCLDIPRAGPSFDVLYRAHFSTDTLGGLTAVHKFSQTLGLNQEGGGKRLRSLPWDGQALQAVLGLCTCPCQHCWVLPSEELLLGQGSIGSTASSACQEMCTQSTDTLQNSWGCACPFSGFHIWELSLQSHGHGQTAFLKSSDLRLWC